MSWSSNYRRCPVMDFTSCFLFSRLWNAVTFLRLDGAASSADNHSSSAGDRPGTALFNCLSGSARYAANSRRCAGVELRSKYLKKPDPGHASTLGCAWPNARLGIITDMSDSAAMILLIALRSMKQASAPCLSWRASSTAAVRRRRFGKHQTPAASLIVNNAEYSGIYPVDKAMGRRPASRSADPSLPSAPNTGRQAASPGARGKRTHPRSTYPQGRDGSQLCRWARTW